MHEAVRNLGFSNYGEADVFLIERNLKIGKKQMKTMTAMPFFS